MNHTSVQEDRVIRDAGSIRNTVDDLLEIIARLDGEVERLDDDLQAAYARIEEQYSDQ